MKRSARFYEWKQGVYCGRDAAWVIVKNLAVAVSMGSALCAAIPGHAFSEAASGEIRKVPFDSANEVVDCGAVGRWIGPLSDQALVGNGSDSIEGVAAPLAASNVPANSRCNCARRDADYFFVFNNKFNDVQSDNLMAMVLFGFLVGQLALVAFLTREFWGGAALFPVAWMIQRYFKIEIWPFCSPGRLYDKREGGPWKVSEFMRRH